MGRWQELERKKEFLEHVHMRQMQLVNEEFQMFLAKRIGEMKKESPKATRDRLIAMMAQECGLELVRMHDYLRAFGLV